MIQLPQRLVFTWGWEDNPSLPPGSTTVEITLSDEGDSTVLRLRHLPKPVTVGSRRTFVAQFVGRRLSFTYYMNQLVLNERLVMSAAEGPFPMETAYTWVDSSSGGTRMRLRNRGQPAGFARVAARVMAAAMRRANRKDFRRLKAILEAEHSSQTPIPAYMAMSPVVCSPRDRGVLSRATPTCAPTRVRG